MLADYVARLERKLDAAELRARDAESSAKDAQNALTEAMLRSARDQKSARDPRKLLPSGAERELQAVRAELDSARQALSQHESALATAREEVARDLRLEYEQKFLTARERMAQAFEKRLAEARLPQTADTDRPAQQPEPVPVPPPEPQTSSGPDETKETAAPIAALNFLASGTLPAMRIVFALLLAAAFAGGMVLGWSAPSSTGNIEKAEATAVPAAAEASASASPAPSSDASSPETVSQVAEPPIKTVEAREAAAPAAGPEQTMVPQVVAAPRRSEEEEATGSAAPSGETKPTPNALSVLPYLSEDLAKAEERNAALMRQIDELRSRLDRANRRATAAESTLAAERKKAALRPDRTIAGDRRRNDQKPLEIEPTAEERALPGPDASRQSAFPTRVPYLPAVE